VILNLKIYSLPRFENLDSGFSLEFYNKENWEKDLYRLEFSKFFLFHFLFFMFLWSLYKTVIYDPGTLSNEYVNIYFFTN